jgi:alpha-L-fucosidase
MDEYIRTIAVPQVREILSNYGKLGVLWWDTPTNMNKERADRLLPLLALQPDIITNNRLGGGYEGDLSTPEQRIPATGMPGRDWETCMTMNGTWGFKSYDDNWKSTETLIHNLVDIVSKGGNYLLNVGPTALGEIPQPSIDRLREIGRWMKVNGDSIYATTANPFPRLPWGRCTKKIDGDRTTLYLHVFDWPTDGKLLVPGLRNRIRRARLLATGQSLQSRVDPDGVVIEVPTEPLDPIDTVIVARVRGDLEIEKVLPKQADDGTMALPAVLADLHGAAGRYARVESIDGKPSIGYWTSDRAWIGWQFKIEKPGTFDVHAEIATPATGSKFEIAAGNEKLAAQAPNTGSYQTFQTVKLGRLRIGQKGDHELSIKPVQGQWSPINLRRIVLKPTP